MPTPEARDLLAMPGFAGGMVNRLSEYETPLDALRAATNVDIQNSGKIKRRPGYTLVQSGAWHSLWGDEALPFMLAVKDGSLVTVTGAGSDLTLRADLGDADVSYAALAGDAYWSNGDLSGMVDADGNLWDWAIATPDPVTCAAYASGGLDAGEYEVVATLQDVSGRESGAGPSTLVEVTEGQGIIVTNLPTIPSGWRGNVYVTDPNGDVLRLAKQLLPGTSSYIIGASPRGRVLETRWLQPLRAGQLVAAGNGRLYVATGPVLRWSEAMRGALHNPAKNYLSFPAPIDLVVSVANGEEGAGLFVSAGSRTYFLSGADPSAWAKRVAFPAGAIRGTGTRVRAGLFGAEYQGFAALFVSTDGGYCLGLPGGQVVPLTESRYVTPVADSGRIFMRRGPGLDQAMALLRGTAANSLRFSDSVSAEVNTYGVSTDS